MIRVEIEVCRRTNTFHQYDVYHDESRVAGYWHGILLAPRENRQRLLDLLAGVRRNTNCLTQVSLKTLDGLSGPKFRCTRSWLHIGIAALIQNLKGERYPIFTGEDARSPGYDLLDKVIGARLILSRIRDGHTPLAGYPDHASKVETTFRMAFKGGLSLFSSGGSELSINSIHFDGHEHHRRHIDRNRIIERIDRLPDSVSLPASVEIDDRRSDHRREPCQAYDDCQLLQLTDILVGGFRTVLGTATKQVHYDVCKPLLQLAERWSKGPLRMSRSKWSNEFCISEAYIEDHQWKFANISPAAEHNQPKLF